MPSITFNNPNTSKWAENDSFVTRVLVSSADILGMFAAPVTVLFAPPSNLQSKIILLVEQILVETVPGTVAYAGGGAVNFVYHGTAVIPHSSTIPATTITAAVASYNQLPPPATVLQVPAATGIDITNATAAFTAGNGTLILTFWYYYHFLGLKSIVPTFNHP